MEECTSCVLLEVREGIERDAYFVHPQPDCRIEVSRLKIEDAYTTDDQIAIYLVFDHHIHAKINTCLRAASNASPYSIIATIDGEFLGTGLYVKEDQSLTLYGGEALLDLRKLRETKPI